MRERKMKMQLVDHREAPDTKSAALPLATQATAAGILSSRQRNPRSQPSTKPS